MRKSLALVAVTMMVMAAPMTAQAAPPPEITMEVIPADEASGLEDGTEVYEDDLVYEERSVSTQDDGSKVVENLIYYKISDMPTVSKSDVSLEGAKYAFMSSGIRNVAVENGGKVSWKVVKKTSKRTRVKVTLTSRKGKKKVVYQTTKASLRADALGGSGDGEVLESDQVFAGDYKYVTTYTCKGKKVTPKALKKWLKK